MEIFTLDKWRTGEYDVFTRRGLKARIVCDNVKDNLYNVLALVDFGNYEVPCCFTKWGSYVVSATDELDIFLKRKENL